MPGANIIAVVSQAGWPSAGTIVAKIAACAGCKIFVVAGCGARAILVAAPVGRVAIAVIGASAIGVGIVAGGEHGASDAVKQFRGGIIVDQGTIGDIAGA